MAGRDSEEPGKPWHPMPDWLRTGASIVLAAVSAYWAIRVDLAITIKDVAFLQATAARHEASIERLRDQAAAMQAAKQAAEK